LTRAEAITYIQQGLAWRTDKSAEILVMMDFMQKDELEKGTSLPWFLQIEDDPLTGTADVAYIDLPSGYIRPVEDGAEPAMFRTASSGRRQVLRRMNYSHMVEYYQDAEDGNLQAETDEGPRAYALRSTRLYFAPVPTVAWTVYHSYYKHDDLPSTIGASGTNLWLTEAPGVLTNLVGMRMADDFEHPEALKKFGTRFASSMARLTAEMGARESADAEIVMGSEA